MCKGKQVKISKEARRGSKINRTNKRKEKSGINYLPNSRSYWRDLLVLKPSYPLEGFVILIYSLTAIDYHGCFPVSC